MKKTWLNCALTKAVVLLPWLVGQSINAEDQWFAGLGVTQNSLRIADTEFQSHALALHSGRWITPGIGIQLAAGLPLDSASAGTASVKTNSLASVGLRLEGATRENNGVAASVTMGGAVVQIDAASALLENQSSYSGHFISSGLTFSIQKNAQVLFDYSYYKFDSNVRMSDIKISYRRRF